jgi:hypothetical protein
LVAYIKRTAHEAHCEDATAAAPDHSDDRRM